jgi:hypothetical protein
MNNRILQHAGHNGYALSRCRSVIALVVVICGLLITGLLAGQEIILGEEFPPVVDAIYERALEWLAVNQQPDGSWSARHEGPGVTGICVMAFLASGDDPNFGRHAAQVRNAIRNIIARQDKQSGYFGGSMYHHGFATLTLAEAYGAMDESLRWQNDLIDRPSPTGANNNSIANALQLAIRCAVDAQQRNPLEGWRYSPNATDTDTSVAGTVLMGLLACRNAGLMVPEQAINQALAYIRRSTGRNGFVAYDGDFGGSLESMNRSAVATLVHAVGKRRDTPEYKATLGHITKRLEHNETAHPYYFMYYMAQALFQGEYAAWEKWNAATIRKLENNQADNGSFENDAYKTAMCLLALALNHRLLPIYER